MKFSSVSLTFLFLAAFTAASEVVRTRELLPRYPLADLYDYAVNHLSERDPLVQDLSNHITAVTRSILAKRMAIPLAHAEAMAEAEALAMPKGGGGKGGGKGGKVDGPGGKGPERQPPPGLDASGTDAWKKCTAFQSNSGDCSAMKGPFAATGCALGSIKGSKPCENKNLQEALTKQRCAVKKDRFCK